MTSIPLHLDCGLPRRLEKDSLFVLKVRVFAADPTGLEEVQCLVEAENWLDGARLKRMPSIRSQEQQQISFNLKSYDSGSANLGVWLKCRNGSRERLFHALVDVNFSRAAMGQGPVHINAHGPSVHHAGGAREGFGQEVSGNVTVNVALPAPQHVENAAQDLDTQWGSVRLIEMPVQVWPGTGVMPTGTSRSNPPGARVDLPAGEGAAPAAVSGGRHRLAAGILSVLALGLVFAWAGTKYFSNPAEGAPPPPPPAPPPSPATLIVKVDKEVYQDGDLQKVTVQVPEDGWLYVGTINADQTVTLYFPNPAMPNAHVTRGQMLTLPPDLATDGLPWRITVELPDGSPEGEEHLFAVLRREPLANLRLTWEADHRIALTNAGILSKDAQRGKISPGFYPPAPDHTTVWSEYKVRRP